jgi:hypothetical protein
MKATLNESGLKKLLAFLEADYPGISKKVIIKDNRLVLPNAGVELMAITELLDQTPPPPGSRPVPAGRPSTDPQMDKAPAKPATIIGKSANSEVRAIGRAGAERVQKEKEAQQVQDMQQYFPTTDKLQKALQDVVGKLAIK